MKAKKVMALVAFFVFCGVVSSQAGYCENVIRKLGRGICNVVAVPFEVAYNIEDVGEESGVMAGATYGVVRGLGHGLVRGVIGVYEVVTFPVSQTEIVEPEFIWENPDRDYEFAL